MAYNIIRLTRTTQVNSQAYFFDANVWIYALQNFHSLHSYEKDYVDFFEEVTNSNLDPYPTILMPTMLISEIVNTYLRQIAMKDFIHSTGITTTIDFKKDYRPSQHFTNAYAQVLDDIFAFEDCFENVNNGTLITNSGFIKSNTNSLDFNDTAYYHYCLEYSKKKPVTLVTNDKDFAVEDIHILTNQPSLLAL